MKTFHVDFATYAFAAFAGPPLSTFTVAEIAILTGYPVG